MRVGNHIASSIKQNGFTILAVLAAMFLSALAANAVITNVSQQNMREREAQLLQVGYLYRQAIKDYYEKSPGSEKQWPKTLKDLTYDTRFVDVRRHLREVYPDPISRSEDWGMITIEAGGRAGISGLYSKSLAIPINTAAVSFADFEMPSITQYSDRKFEYVPTSTAPANAVNSKSSL